MAKELSSEQQSWKQGNRCPLCGEYVLYLHDYLNGQRVDGFRLGPLKDPAAMSECPSCGGRWFVYHRDLLLEVMEGERTKDVDAEQTFDLDNRLGTTPLRRTKVISREWSQQIELSAEQSSSTATGLQIGQKDVATLTATVEKALKTTGRMAEETRRTYTETLDFEVPNGVLRTVTLTFRRVWQHGVVRAEQTDGTITEQPFCVVVDLELDVKQADTKAEPQSGTAVGRPGSP